MHISKWKKKKKSVLMPYLWGHKLPILFWDKPNKKKKKGCQDSDIFTQTWAHLQPTSDTAATKPSVRRSESPNLNMGGVRPKISTCTFHLLRLPNASRCRRGQKVYRTCSPVLLCTVNIYASFFKICQVWNYTLASKNIPSMSLDVKRKKKHIQMSQTFT